MINFSVLKYSFSQIRSHLQSHAGSNYTSCPNSREGKCEWRGQVDSPVRALSMYRILQLGGSVVAYILPWKFLENGYHKIESIETIFKSKLMWVTTR